MGKKKNNSPHEGEVSGDQKKNDGGVDGGGKGGADQNGNGKEKAEKRVATTVLKMNLHCDGCLHKIYKTVSRTRGYIEMKVDREKDQLMVTGVIDEKALAETLRKQMRRNVEIVPPKKDKSGGGGGEKKENAGGEKGGGEKAVVVGCDKAASDNCPYTTTCACGRGYQIHCNYPFAPQLFSDEEANACHVM